MKVLRKIISIFVHLILLLTVITVIAMATYMMRMDYYYIHYEPHTYDHARSLMRCHKIFRASSLDSETVHGSPFQSVKEGE